MPEEQRGTPEKLTERLTTRQVADRLGVKPETVYAYVSRGQLRSERTPGGRGSTFDPAEVDRLAENSRRTADGGGAPNQPLISTKLTLMRDGELYYRGLTVAELARTTPFEQVAGLLWTGELCRPAEFAAAPDTLEQVLAVAAVMPAGARMPDLLRVIPPVVAAADPLRFDLSPESVIAASAGLLGVMVEALPLRGHAVSEAASGAASGSASDAASEAPEPGRVPHDAFARRLWPRLTDRPATPDGIRILNAALVVLADHDLAASTLAGRVAASARAHPYAVLSAALGAFDGPLHGNAGSHTYRLFAQALSSGDPVGAYADRLRVQGWVEGFNHQAYPEGDPRARVLLDLLAEVEVPEDLRTVAQGLIGAARRRGPHLPNIDFALPLLVHAYGMVPDAGEVIFILARTAGWIAHALEEYREPALRYRYHGTYSGSAPE